MKRDHAQLVAELADQHGQMVFATVYRVLGDADDADDAFQQVFLKLLDAAPGSFQTDSVRDWGAYLRVAASRCAVDLLREKLRRQQKKKEFCERGNHSPGDSSRHLSSRNDTADIVRHALSALTKRDAQVVALRYFECLTYAEIAAHMQLTKEQVGVILHRGRRRLREILEPKIASVPVQRQSRKETIERRRG